eukprot:4579456-Pyramimonas_sp.AAC.1
MAEARGREGERSAALLPRLHLHPPPRLFLLLLIPLLFLLLRLFLNAPSLVQTPTRPSSSLLKTSSNRDSVNAFCSTAGHAA